MQPIGDYLKKLLYQYDCIVVPTLGAFLTHSVSASFSEATGQFLPPRRKVAFNEALMLDDGILLNYVMLHEGISRDQALAHINSFVAALKQQARQMGSFSIEGLGLFSYNEENSLQFDPELRHNFLGSTYGMQAVMLPGRIVHLAQPMPVVKPMPVVQVRQLPALASTLTTALAVTTDEEEGQVYALPARRSGAAWRWAGAALLVGSLGLISYFSVIRPGEPLQSSLNPASLFKVPSFLGGTPQEVAAPVKSEPVESVVTKPVDHSSGTLAALPPSKPTSPAVSDRESLLEARKSAVNQPSAPEAAAAVQPQTKTNANNRFTVIAGSFASRRNAVRFQKRLLKAGYSDAYILQGRGLIKVAAIGTASLTEAEAGIDSLNALTGVTPWIMRNQ